MSDPSPKKITPREPGFFENLTVQIKLILRLLADRRVSPLLKLLPIGALAYMLIPDPLPYIEDPIVIWLGSALFIELCPQEIVKEHRDALTSVIEGEWREIEEDETKADSDQDALPSG